MKCQYIVKVYEAYEGFKYWNAYPTYGEAQDVAYMLARKYNKQVIIEMDELD